jgi:hypothetical protein
MQNSFLGIINNKRGGQLVTNCWWELGEGETPAEEGDRATIINLVFINFLHDNLCIPLKDGVKQK